MAKYVLLDTETTGTSEEDRIIQLGYIVLEGKKETEVYNEFCSSERPISFGAMEVHGITPEMIEGKLTCTQTQAYKELEALNVESNYMVIHNAPFDLGMLAKEGFTCKMKLIDTLRCAKHVFDDSEAHRLQFFRYQMGLYKEEQAEADALGIEVKAHDAIGDVLVMKLFLSRLREAVQERFAGESPVEKLVELTKKPVLIKSFRFGKYRGKKIADVAQEDAGYLRWMQSNMDLDEDMKYTLATLI
ncbi:MAG: exonuclease domain-containing protein [Campylobacterota bacterium]|nr:exonuclease domain-containing protein [Campylobacterota bacterium]